MKGFGRLKPFDVLRGHACWRRLLAFTVRLGIFFWHPDAGVDS